jgi:hypothetical protein
VKVSAKLNIELATANNLISDDRVVCALWDNDIYFLNRTRCVSIVITLGVFDKNARTGLRPSAGRSDEDHRQRKTASQHRDFLPPLKHDPEKLHDFSDKIMRRNNALEQDSDSISVNLAVEVNVRTSA